MLVFHTQKLRKQSTPWVGLLNMQRKLKCQGGKEVREESSICSMILCARAKSVPQLETAWCKVGAHVQLCLWSTSVVDTAMLPRSLFRNEGLRPQVPAVLPVDSLQLSPHWETASVEDSFFIQGCDSFWGQPNPMTGKCRVKKPRPWPQVSKL